MHKPRGLKSPQLLWRFLSEESAWLPLSRSCARRDGSAWCLPAGSGMGTTPDHRSADTVRELLADHRSERLYDRSDAVKALPAAEMLGPAILAYPARKQFRPTSGSALEQPSVEHPDLRALENRWGPEERSEASIGRLTSRSG